MGFNSAFKGLMALVAVLTIDLCCYNAASDPHAARAGCRGKNNIQIVGVHSRMSANSTLKSFRKKGDP